MLNTGSRTAATSEITVGRGLCGRCGSVSTRARRRAPRKSARIAARVPSTALRGMLGQFLEFSLSAEPLARAFEFYRSLGFQPVTVGDQLEHPYVALSDGGVAIGLHARPQDGPLLTFVRPQLRDYARALRRAGIELEQAALADDEFNRVLFADPSGQRVALLEARTFAPSEWNSH